VAVGRALCLLNKRFIKKFKKIKGLKRMEKPGKTGIDDILALTPLQEGPAYPLKF
jgi:translation initiation factor 2 beta subunit (eIF-2beta)/eIF-5